MNPVNLYEAYSAVYSEDLSVSVDENLSFVDDLSDNELVQIMEEILSEEEVTLQECLDVFDAELLSEETEMERMNRLQNKATRERKAAAATAKREKSAERERVGRKHAVKRLQVAATRAGRNLADRAKTLGAGAASVASAGASEAGRKAKEGVEKVKGKLASAKEKIKGLIKSGRKAAASGLRGLASKVEPKEQTGKEVKAAAKEAVSAKKPDREPAPYRMVGKTGGTRVASGSGERKALPPVGKTKSGKDLTPQQRGMQTAAQNRRLANRLGEDFDLLAEIILEDLINNGYAETFEGALEVLESYSDYEVGELAENYLTEERVDLFDVILEHLLEEGYADTEQSATVIMANMSEEWREEILNGLDEAQKPLPTEKMKRRRFYVNMKTGEAAGSSRNQKIDSVLQAHKKDPEGEAAKAKEKSKYTG